MANPQIDKIVQDAEGVYDTVRAFFIKRHVEITMVLATLAILGIIF